MAFGKLSPWEGRAGVRAQWTNDSPGHTLGIMGLELEGLHLEPGARLSQGMLGSSIDRLGL